MCIFLTAANARRNGTPPIYVLLCLLHYLPSINAPFNGKTKAEETRQNYDFLSGSPVNVSEGNYPKREYEFIFLFNKTEFLIWQMDFFSVILIEIYGRLQLSWTFWRIYRRCKN
jgi:hypothetical protein